MTGTTGGMGAARFGSGRSTTGYEPATESDDEGLTVRTETRGAVAVVFLSGEVDLHSCADLRTTLQRLTESGQARIVIDMSAVPYIDSAGLGVLVDTQRRVREQGGEVCLSGAAEFVLRALEITRLIRIFRTSATVDEAVQGLSA